MKNFILTIFLFSSTLVATAQHTNQCGIIIPPKSLRSNFASVYEAGGYINNISNRINWNQNFQVREQNGINNAYATIIGNQRYIVYDNNFLESLDHYAGTKWASISVLAHEMGHHYYNHMFSNAGSTPSKELEADYFSGYAMAKLGAGLEEAKAAMSQIASPRANASHPAKASRLNAIANGWNAAKGITNNNTTNRERQVPQQSKRSAPVANDARWIHLSLHSNLNMTVFLSDDGRNYTPAQLNKNQPFVFMYEVYDYGWLRLGNNRNARTYRLHHGKDYAVVFNRRMNSWTLVEI